MPSFFEKNKTFVAIIIAAFIIGGFIYLLKAPSIGPILPKEKTTTEIVKENINAVVLINCLDKKGNLLGGGSGFFITPDGKLVTNYHVIEGCDQLQVKFYTAGFFPVQKILGADKSRDIAVLKVDGVNLPTVKLGNSDKIEVGEKIIAIGSPLGIFENTITEGIISAVKTSLEVFGEAGEFIQMTAQISPGNSGGALLNTEGETIGVPTITLSTLKAAEVFGGIPQSLNFAIPINDIKNFLFDKLTLEVKRFTENAEYYYLAGVLAYNKNSYDEAIENFKKAISLDDKYVDAYIDLGIIYYEKGLWDLQLEMFKKAVQLEPTNSDAHYYLATAYEDMGQYDLAIVEYKEVIKLRPNDKDAIYALGILYVMQGEKNKALELVPKLIELNPGLGNELKILIDKMK